MKQLPILAGALVLATATSASAQANACKTKVFVDSVYAHQTAAGRYEYILQLRSLIKKPVSYQIDFRNMPAGVNPYKPQITSGTTPLGPGASTTLRFGSGTNSNVSVNTVSVGIDTPGSAITVSNCK